MFGLDVQSSAVQEDGKIIIGGFFSIVNDVLYPGLARLNADGSLDTTFKVGSGQDGDLFSSIQLQKNGKIIIAGSLENYSGFPSRYIARLNEDGSFDTTFKSKFDNKHGYFTYVYDAKVLDDNKILACGDFETYDGVKRGGIVRLNADGSLDTTFKPATGVPDSIETGNVVTSFHTPE